MPTTHAVSAEAAAALAMLPPRAEAPNWPAPDDVTGWQGPRAEAVETFAGLNAALLAVCAPDVSEATISGTPCLEVRPQGWRDDGRVIVGLHGGAYVLHSARSTLGAAALVARATGARVLSIDYGLAPESRWRATVEQVCRVFREVIATQGAHAAGPVFGYGESAGGGLLLGATLKLLHDGHPVPKALAIISPWADLTDTGESRQAMMNRDPMLRQAGQLDRAAAAYCDAPEQGLPYVSPVYATYDKTFPPTLIQGGTREILLSDFVRLHAAMIAGGARSALDLQDGMPHVYPILLGAAQAPEAIAAYQRLAAFLDVNAAA